MFCAKCGHDVGENSNFCPNCGFRLDGTGAVSSVSGTSAPRVEYTPSTADELSVGSVANEDTEYFKKFVEENNKRVEKMSVTRKRLISGMIGVCAFIVLLIIVGFFL